MLENLETGALESLLNRFHYPPDLAGEELQRERESLRRSMKILMDVFGRPKEAAAHSGNHPFLEVGAGAGDAEYWRSMANLGRDESIVYSVRFEKAGPGFVHLVFVRGVKGSELHSLHFGLPPDDAATKRFIAEAVEKLQEARH